MEHTTAKGTEVLCRPIRVGDFLLLLGNIMPGMALVNCLNISSAISTLNTWIWYEIEENNDAETVTRLRSTLSASIGEER